MKKHDLNFRKNILLADLTSLRVGGKAHFFVEVKNERQLLEAVGFSRKNDLPIFVLGGGSDILVSDRGIPGLVIRYNGDEIKFKKRGDYALITTGAGVVWDRLVEIAVDKGLQGIECMSGIPGTVGASPIQNIGAYGQELKDVFYELRAYDKVKNDFVKFNKKACRFAYRESIFKKPKYRERYVITNVTLKLQKTPPNIIYESLKYYLYKNEIKNPKLIDIRKAVLALRSQRLDDPHKIANAGSFFKNPFIDSELFEKLKKNYPDIPFHKVKSQYKLFAGWLIEKAGWKGKIYKNAKVSDKNALVITNPQNRATSKEIQELANKISNDVYKKFKVRIEPEVQFIE